MATPVKRISDFTLAAAALMTMQIPVRDPALAVGLQNQKITGTQLATLLWNNTALTGVPTAPTAAVNTSTTQIATTAFVQAQLAVFLNNLPPIYASAYGMATTNSAAVNTTALNNAINAAALNGGARVMLPRGVCDVNNLNPAAFNNVTITGQGRYGGSTLRFMQATGDNIPLATWGHLGVEDVYITYGVRRTSGWAIRIYGGCFTPFVRNVRIDYGYNGILVENAGEVIVENVTYRYMYGPRRTQIGGVSNGVYRSTLKDIRSDNPVPNVTYGPVKTYAPSTNFNANDIVSVNGKVWQCSVGGLTGASSSPNAIPGTTAADGFTTVAVDGAARWLFVYDALSIHLLIDSYAYSTFAEGIVGINGLSAAYVADGLNTGSSHPIWMWLTDLEGDHNYGDTVTLAAGEGFRAINSWFGSSLQGNGITIGPLFKGEVLVQSTRIVASWLHGVLWYNGPCAVKIDDCDIGHNSVIGSGTCHGIFMVGGITQGVTTGNVIGPLAVAGWLGAPNNQGYAIYMDTGATNNVTHSLNDLRGNVSGALQDLSTKPNNNIIVNNQGLLNSGEWYLIASTSASGASGVVCVCDPSKYEEYKVVFWNVTFPVDDGLSLRTSATGGPPFDSGAIDYLTVFSELDGGGYVRESIYSGNAAYFHYPIAKAGTAYPAEGEIYFASPQTAKRTAIRGELTFQRNDNVHAITPILVYRDTAAAFDAVQILTAAFGTLSGEFRFYGRVK